MKKKTKTKRKARRAIRRVVTQTASRKVQRVYANPPADRLTKEQVQNKLRSAATLYEKFHGEDPRFVTAVKLRAQDKILLQIGKLVGVMYEARRDGVTKKFLHQFTGASRPVLASSHDGRQLYVVGGNYDFTEDGITDRK